MTKLASTVVLLFAVSSLQAATVTNYFPTRDTFMRGAADAPQLHGTSTNGRASKAYLDFYITDFDRTVIRGAIEAQLGHSLTLEDMASIELSLNLFSNDLQGYKPTAFSRPAVFQGTQDWVEGSNDTFGATKAFANYDPANPANNRTWKDISGSDVAGFFNLGEVENASFEEWGGDAYTYRKWVLDDAVEFAYLTDPLSLGLFLNASDAGNPDDIDAQYNNTEIYSREVTDPDRLPFLEVIVIPEPSSFAMLGFGVLVFVRRRRRPTGLP